MEFAGTLDQQFRGHVQRSPSEACLFYGDVVYSWREVDEAADVVAGALQERGVEAGDLVGVLMKNTPELAWTFVACQKLGAAASLLNTRVSPDAILSMIENEQHRVVVCGDSFEQIYRDVRLQTLPVDVVVAAEDGQSRSDWAGTEGASPAGTAVLESAVCSVIHTSGTTGNPKGSAFTHKSQTLSGLQYALEMGLDRTRVGLAAAPIVVGAATNFFVSYLFVVGAAQVLVKESDPDALLDALTRRRVSEIFAVPAQIHQLLRRLERRGDVDAGSLRLIRTGGSPVSTEMIRAARDSFGADVLNTYGTTESCTAITVMNTAVDAPEKWESIGKPSYFQEVLIEAADVGHGEEPGATLRGHLLNRGPQAAETEFRRPDRQLKDADGWQHTRDVVEVDDDGYIYLIDRVDNVIISGGENIYPQAVERVIHDEPRVSDVGVSSVPDDEWGEKVVALIVPEDGVGLDAEDIERRCLSTTQIPKHWRPRSIGFVDELPRNILGKLDRKALRELAELRFSAGTSEADE